MYRVGRWIALGALASLAMASGNLAKDREAPARSKSLPVPTTKNMMAVKRGTTPLTFEIQEAKPIPASQVGAPLSEESLQQMLENLGYEPKESTSDSGHKSYQITVVRGTWTIYVTFDLSTDKSYVWLSSFFGAVPNPDQTSPAPLFTLLAKNNDIWPSYFVYVPSSKGLWMYRPLANNGVKPATLRNTLETFMSNIQDTADDWDMSKWAATPAATSGETK